MSNLYCNDLDYIFFWYDCYNNALRAKEAELKAIGDVKKGDLKYASTKKVDPTYEMIDLNNLYLSPIYAQLVYSAPNKWEWINKYKHKLIGEFKGETKKGIPLKSKNSKQEFFVGHDGTKEIYGFFDLQAQDSFGFLASAYYLIDQEFKLVELNVGDLYQYNGKTYILTAEILKLPENTLLKRVDFDTDLILWSFIRYKKASGLPTEKKPKLDK